MTTDRAKKLGEGNIPYLLLTFSVPAIIGTVAQALYYVVDRIFVGQAVGPDGIAGITVAFPFMLILLAFAMLVGFGATALVSIRLGEQKRNEAEQVLGNAFSLLVVASVVLTVVGLALLDPLLKAFGASQAVLPFAHDYLKIIVLGSVFQVVGFGLNAVIRGEGNPRIAMFTLLIGVLLNVVLAPILILGFGLGMKGAALATVASQAVSAVWVLAYFLGGRSLLKLRPANLRWHRPICAAIFALGSPLFVMQLAAGVMNGLLNHQLHDYGGDLAVSAMGIIYAVFMMIAMPIFGINQGAQPIIGYNYGAENFDRVKRALQTAVAAASAIALSGFLLTTLFPSQLIRLFSRQDEALLDLGTHAMRTCTMMLPLVGFQIVSSSYFQAVGKPRHALVLSLSRQVLILIPAVLVLPYFFGLDGVWAAFPTADFTSSLITGVWLFLELRHLHRRHQENAAPTVPLPSSGPEDRTATLAPPQLPGID